jgi:uncharacterized protein YjdB
VRFRREEPVGSEARPPTAKRRHQGGDNALSMLERELQASDENPRRTFMMSRNWTLAILAMSMAACSGQGESSMADPDAGDPQSEPEAPFSEVTRAALSEVSVDIDSQGTVAFFHTVDGARVPYEKSYDGDVIAQREGENRYHLWLKRGEDLPQIELGYLDGGTLKLCGHFEIDGQQREFDCDALFLKTPGHSSPGPDGASPARMTAVIGYYNVASAPKDASRIELIGEPTSLDQVIDLSSYALNQINQQGTGTCYYNSTTGILEWFYNQQTGRVLDISEPSLVGAGANREMESVTDSDMVAKASKMAGVVPNSLMPVLSYYTSSASFGSVSSQAVTALSQIPSSSRVALPFRLTVNKLFWYGRWNSGQTTEADYQAAVNWIVQKRLPIHLQVTVGGYWHAIIMLGYNSNTGEVLIKDSLGRTDLKASWRPKTWFMTETYGAMGVDLVGGTNVPVTSVSVNTSSLSLAAGQTYALAATVSPANASNKAVVWASSNNRIATVNSSGVVSAVAAGAVTITATTVDGNKTAACSITVTNGSLTYCRPSVGSSFQWISLVRTGTINNATSTQTGYSDYTSQSTNIPVGTAAAINLVSGWATSSSYWNVWIDYNHNGSFNDSGELVVSNNFMGSNITTSFKVPSTASLGPTRMRVMMRNSGVSDPCSLRDGEVEDYTVNITPR